MKWLNFTVNYDDRTATQFMVPETSIRYIQRNNSGEYSIGIIEDAISSAEPGDYIATHLRVGSLKNVGDGVEIGVCDDK